MKPDDPNISWIEEPQLGLAGKLYLPLFVQGLTTTFKHLTRSLSGPPQAVQIEPFQLATFCPNVLSDWRKWPPAMRRSWNTCSA